MKACKYYKIVDLAFLYIVVSSTLIKMYNILILFFSQAQARSRLGSGLCTSSGFQPSDDDYYYELLNTSLITPIVILLLINGTR